MRSLFSWGNDAKIPPVSTEETTAGASPLASDLATAQSVQANEAAKRELESSAARRGRPRKASPIGSGNLPPVSTELQAELIKQTEAVFEPEAWGALLAMPGDAMAAITARELWELSKDERKTLGVTGSAVARSMMITNPRGLAFLMLSAALFSAYVPRAIKDIKQQKEAARMKAKEEKKMPGPTL